MSEPTSRDWRIAMWVAAAIAWGFGFASGRQLAPYHISSWSPFTISWQASIEMDGRNYAARPVVVWSFETKRVK